MTRWKRRDRKRFKRRYGMRISGRGVKLLQEIIRKRADKIRSKKNA